MRNLITRLMLVVALSGVGVLGASAKTTGVYTDSEIASKLAHEIRMYPNYTIWDNIDFRVVDGNVDLSGQVSQPFKKADLGRLAQRIPGVQSVTNELQVLPNSNFDDQIRVAVARAIYRNPEFTRYAMQAVPPIHIIVDNGHVTLEGIVANETDKNLAALRASGVLSLGRITNNLRVENSSART